MNNWRISYKDNVTGREVSRCDVSSIEYHGEWMGDIFVTVDVKSAVPIDFAIGDYIMYRGEKFVINYDPTVIKKARRGTYGEGFTYDGIKLNALVYELSDVRMLDYVLGDNQLHYSGLPKFSFFCESVDDLADRLQVNSDRYCEENGFAKEDYWTFITPSRQRTLQRCTTSELKSVAEARHISSFGADGGNTSVADEQVNQNVSIDNQSVWESCKYIKDTFGLNFIVRGRSVIIGCGGLPTVNVFKYGKDNGLYEIERTADSDQQIVTKLYAYGSDKNLATRYYASLNLQVFAKVDKIINNYDTSGLHYAAFLLDLPFDSKYFTTRSKSYPGTSDMPNYIVRMTANGNTVTGYCTRDSETGLCSIYSEFIGDQDDDRDETDESAMNAFSEAIAKGDTVYLVSNVKKEAFPASHKNYATENLPNNMAVNVLMMPGFPNQSLYEWVKGHGGTGCDDATGKATWHGYTAVFSKEQYRPFVQSVNHETLGIREATKYFNGSDGEDEVYPTIENVTYGGIRVDKISDVDKIDDNGVYTDTPKDFTITLPNFGSDFDMKGLLQSDTAISVKDGYCGGRDFTVKNVAKQSNGKWLCTCERSKDDSLDLWFPYSHGVSSGGTSSKNEPYQLRSGDRYVLTGIEMTDVYVQAAAEKLLESALAFLAKNDYTRYTYLPKVDEIYMARQHDEAKASDGEVRSMYETLKEGDIMLFEDDDLNIDGSVYIDTLTIKEYGNGQIPTYDVTLRNDKQVGTIQRIQEKIDSLTSGGSSSGNGNGGSGMSIPQTRQLIESYGEGLFVSKVNADSAAGLITFLAGLTSNELARFLKGINVTGYSEFNDGVSFNDTAEFYGGIHAESEVSIVDADVAVSGGDVNVDNGDVIITGTDNKIKAPKGEIDDLTAQKIYVDNLVAKVAHFFELSIDEIKSVGGQIILTPANAEIDRVETLGNGDYKCYFKATDGERKISQQFAVGDQVVCATFDAATGTSYNVSNKYYWRLVTEVSSGVVQIDGDDYHYIVMSGTDKDSDSTGIPEAGDKIAQLGSRSSADRQSAIILSAYNGEFLDKGIQAPSMVQYSGINDFTLSSHRQTVISKGLNEFRGTFRATSGKTIEDIIDEQTTEKASEAAPYINDSGYWVVNGVVTDKKARGEQGDKGDKGDSVTVTGSVVKYSTKTTSSKPADSTFTQNSAPTGVKNGYVWSKTTVTYSDGSSVSTYSCTYQGKDGRSMTSKTTYYAVTDDEEQPRDSDFVSTEFPVVSEGQWVWTRTVETYSEGSDVVSYGVYRVGTDGVNGVSGEPGQDGRSSYMHIAYAMDAAGTGFSLTYFDGALYIGTYTDDQQADAADYTKYEWARLKGEKGDTGQKGDKGETGAQGPAGKSSYTHIKRMSDFLPEGYTKLQWTGSRRTGMNPYLSTELGTSVTAGFKLRYRHHYTDATAKTLSGQVSNSDMQSNAIWIGRDGSDGFYARWGQQYYPANAEDRPTLPAETWAVASINFNDTRKWTLETETGVTAEGDLDGEIYTNSSGGAYNNFRFAILGYNNQSRNMDVSDYQLTQNGKLAAWFIPARREEDGKVGMYDIVRQRFKGPSPASTSYTFTAGPEDEANWGDRYIGIAVTESAEAPTNAAAYDWMQVGGAGVKGMTRHYLLTNAAEGVTWDTAGWTTTAGQTSSEQKYLWEYDEVEYTDGRSSVKTTPVRTGMYAEDAELYVIRHVSNTLRAEDGMLTGRAEWSLHHITGSTDTEEDVAAFRWKTDTGSQWQEVTGAAFAVELNNTAEYYNNPHAVMVEAMKAGVTVASDTASIVWDGTEVYTADFDDEMLSVACDEDGNVLDENVLYDWLPKVRLYKGSKLVEKDRREWFKYFNAYSEELYLGTTFHDDCVEIGIEDIKPAFNNKDTAKIDVYYYATEAEYDEAGRSDYLTGCIAHCTATVNKVRTGKDAEMWSLMVSDNALHKGKNDTTATPAQVTVKVVRTKGTERTEMDFAAWTAAGLTVTYTLNGQTRGGSASHYPIATSGATTALRVELRKGTTLIDVETVPLVTDGKDGTSVSIKGSYATRALIESTVTNPSVGDGYIDLSTGHLIVYTGVTDPGDNSPWEDVGQVKGDAGDSSYLFIAWMKGDASGRTGTMVYGEPTDDTYTWWGYAVSMTNTRPTTESNYTWQYVKGAQGDTGERGPAGEKGDASVTHVRYSDDGKTFKYRDQTYREVEFIENQYRYFGYIPVNAYGGHGSETRIVIDFMLTARASASYNNCLFAFRRGERNYTNRILILYNNGGKCLRLMMYAGDATDSTIPAEELINIPYEFGTRMKIDMSYAGVIVNDMDVYNWPEGKDYSTWKETAYSLRLFTGQSGSTAWVSNYYAYGRIYSLQIWQGDELTLDNVPCINEETKKVVMWNRAKDAIGFVANNDTMGYSLSSGREKGENRLLNGDFSQGLDYWVVGDDGNVMTAEAVSVDGKGTALRLLSSDVTTVNGKNNAVRSAYGDEGNRFLGYHDTEDGCWVSFDVRAESAATFIVGVTWNSQASYLKVAEVEATTEWTHHEAWIAKPTNYYLRQIVLNAGTANVAIYVTRVKVEYGDKATAWSASPDDGALYRNYKVGGKYRGEYTDNTLADSEQFSDYVWVQAEGEQGPQGEPGEPGEPGKSAEMYVIRTEKNDLHVDQSGTIRGGIRSELHHIVGSEDAAVESGFTYSYGLDTTGATEATLSGKINVNAYDGMDVEEYVSGGNYPRSLTVTVRKDGAVVATEVYQMVYDGERGDSIAGEPAEFHRLYAIAEKAVVGYSETTKKYPLALELVYQIQHIVGGTTSYEDVAAANNTTGGYWLRFHSDVDSTNVNFTDGTGTKTGRYVNSDYIADYHAATAKPTMLTVELCHKNGTAVEVVDTRTVMVTFATSATLVVNERLNTIEATVQGSDGLSQQVAQLKATQDKIEGRVTKTETGIGSLNDKMSQKVDQSIFEQQANEIKSSVKSVEKKLPDTKNLFGASVYEGGALGDDESNTWMYVWGGVKHYCHNMENYGTPIHKGEFTWYNQQNGNTALYSPCVQLDADWYTLRMRLYKIELGSMKIEVRRYRNQTDDPSNYIGSYTVADWWGESDTDKEDNRLRLFRNQIPQGGLYRLCLINGNHNDSLNEDDNDLSDLCGGDIQLYRGQLESSDFNDFDTTMSEAYSRIRQTASSIELKVKETGIDIDEKKIRLKAENTVVDGNLTVMNVKTIPAEGGAYAQMMGSVLAFFGSAGKANIRIGVNEDGMAVLQYYDNNGVLLYDLGPSGISSIPVQQEHFTSISGYVVEDMTGEGNAITPENWTWMFNEEDMAVCFNPSTPSEYLYTYYAKIVAGVIDKGNSCSTEENALNANGRLFRMQAPVGNRKYIDTTEIAKYVGDDQDWGKHLMPFCGYIREGNVESTKNPTVLGHQLTPNATLVPLNYSDIQAEQSDALDFTTGEDGYYKKTVKWCTVHAYNNGKRVSTLTIFSN